MRFRPSPGVEVCTDHSCIWGSFGGMGTNGGCECLKDLMRLPVDVRHNIQKNILAMRDEITLLRRKALGGGEEK